jgi:hypothetical protein
MEGRALDERTDPRKGQSGAGRHRFAEDLDVSFGRLDQAQQHPDRGGLARAVGAEEAEDGPDRHVEVE